jgi:hypothetical protein
MPVQIASGLGRGGIQELGNDMDRPAFLERDWMWMGTGRSEFTTMQVDQ